MNAAKSVLERLKAEESAAVLKTLLERHQALRGEAEEIATELLSSPSAEGVADNVLASLTFIGIDAVNGRAGRKPWGYVDPTDAAWELLEEALEDVISGMKRAMQLGLADAAEAMCRGIVAGLRRAEEEKPEGALGWAPDFPAEEACNVVEELLRVCPKERRKETRDHLLDAFARDVPEWSEMLERAAKQAVSRR
jgi:hypothetical protein